MQAVIVVGEDDELPCVMKAKKTIWRGSRRSEWGSFHRQDAVYRKERL